MKTAVVTGAASGIGAACARLLLQEGWNVCALDRTAADQFAERAQCLVRQADVADEAGSARIIEETKARFGALDALFHFAAAHDTHTLDELDAETFNHILAVNVTGSFLMARACARAMRWGGAVVLTGSGSINVSGLGGNGRGGPAYVASKAAIIGLTRALARSLAPLGIRVNAVSPGATDTAMTAEYSPDARARVAERTLAGRMGTPEEIAKVAIFLASDDAAYMTGEIVNVNGGGSFG